MRAARRERRLLNALTFRNDSAPSLCQLGSILRAIVVPYTYVLGIPPLLRHYIGSITNLECERCKQEEREGSKETVCNHATHGALKEEGRDAK